MIEKIKDDKFDITDIFLPKPRAKERWAGERDMVQRIEALRLRKFLSRWDFREEAGLNQQYRLWHWGFRDLHGPLYLEQIIKIAKFFDVSLPWLMFGLGDPPPGYDEFVKDAVVQAKKARAKRARDRKALDKLLEIEQEAMRGS